jgi:hypothetical protein
LIAAGFFGAVVGVSGYLFKNVHEAEDLLPDHEVKVLEDSRKEAVGKGRVGVFPADGEVESQNPRSLD